MVNQFITHRQAAIKWLNGKRDFSAGISILETSKFKPGVVAKLKKVGEKGPEAKARLTYLMRSLVQAWAMSAEEAASDIDPATGVSASEEPTIYTDSSAAYIQMAAEQLTADPEAFPKNISSVIREYADAYKKRDILHKQLSSLPEDNDEATIAKRKALSDEIQKKSVLMEDLYPLYEKYLTQKQDISDDDLQSISATAEDSSELPRNDNPSSDNGSAQALDSLSKEDLQKMRKSIATKISRAKNMLEYQQETKAATPNPLPESPKRVKYEKKIQILTEELERIDYAIAQFG